MNNALLVCGTKAIAELREELISVVMRHWSALRDVGREVLSIEELHRDPRDARGLVDAGCNDVNDVLALDLRTDARLLHEALACTCVGDERGLHDLKRAALAGRELLDRIHGAHAALGQWGKDAEVARKDGASSELHCVSCGSRRAPRRRAPLRGSPPSRVCAPSQRELRTTPLRVPCRCPNPSTGANKTKPFNEERRERISERRPNVHIKVRDAACDSVERVDDHGVAACGKRALKVDACGARLDFARLNLSIA